MAKLDHGPEPPERVALQRATQRGQYGIDADLDDDPLDDPRARGEMSVTVSVLEKNLTPGDVCQRWSRTSPRRMYRLIDLVSSSSIDATNQCFTHSDDVKSRYFPSHPLLLSN